VIRDFRDERNRALASGNAPKGVSHEVARGAVVKLFFWQL
jgi:hypothetical protein